MSIEQTFTQPQVLFLFDKLFGLLKSDFNYDLSDKKRKALLARLLKARNFDALLQRSSSHDVESALNIVSTNYQWFDKEVNDGEVGLVQIGDPQVDEIVLSELVWSSKEDAIESIINESCGIGPEDMTDAILVEVQYHERKNPFLKKPIGMGSMGFSSLKERDVSEFAIKINPCYINPLFSEKMSESKSKKSLIIKNGQDLKRVIDASDRLKFVECDMAEALYIDDKFCDLVFELKTPLDMASVNIEMSLDLSGEKISCRPMTIIYSCNEFGLADKHITIDPQYTLEQLRAKYYAEGGESTLYIPEKMLEEIHKLIKHAYPFIVEPWLNYPLTK
jgi:hypothetical protein